jgi:hypothetical protein
MLSPPLKQIPQPKHANGQWWIREEAPQELCSFAAQEYGELVVRHHV